MKCQVSVGICDSFKTVFILDLSGVPGKSSNRDLTAILSKSAPASTTQSLLGNFEVNLNNYLMLSIQYFIMLS